MSVLATVTIICNCNLLNWQSLGQAGHEKVNIVVSVMAISHSKLIGFHSSSLTSKVNAHP